MATPPRYATPQYGAVVHVMNGGAYHKPCSPTYIWQAQHPHNSPHPPHFATTTTATATATHYHHQIDKGFSNLPSLPESAGGRGCHEHINLEAFGVSPMDEHNMYTTNHQPPHPRRQRACGRSCRS